MTRRICVLTPLTRPRSTEAIRYLDCHHALPEDSPPELRDSFDVQLSALLLNSALAALRAGGGANARLALRSTDRALSNLTLNDTDKGASSRNGPWRATRLADSLCCEPVFVLVFLHIAARSNARAITAKAYYRAGLAHVQIHEDDEAEESLVKAHALVRDDKAIAHELEQVRGRLRAKRDKEKAAFKKMFA